MVEYQDQYSGADSSVRLRDLEERQRLLKDRILMIGKSLIDSRDKTFSEIQEMKKVILILKEENSRLKLLVERMAEQLNNSARKEELAILQRQLDLLRK